MFKNLNSTTIILINLLLIVTWNLIITALCGILSEEKFFNPNLKLYKPLKFEQNTYFYAKHLKIKKWKDKLPQYIMKNGFSKQCFLAREKEYIDKFLIEICRAEWNHIFSALYFIITIIINFSFWRWIFASLVLISQIPFLCIQRYNYIRMQKLREKIKPCFSRKVEAI